MFRVYREAIMRGWQRLTASTMVVGSVLGGQYDINFPVLVKQNRVEINRKIGNGVC